MSGHLHAGTVKTASACEHGAHRQADRGARREQRVDRGDRVCVLRQPEGGHRDDGIGNQEVRITGRFDEGPARYPPRGGDRRDLQPRSFQPPLRIGVDIRVGIVLAEGFGQRDGAGGDEARKIV